MAVREGLSLTLLTLKVEDGGRGPGSVGGSKRWQKQGKSFLSRAALPTLPFRVSEAHRGPVVTGTQPCSAHTECWPSEERPTRCLVAPLEKP